MKRYTGHFAIALGLAMLLATVQSCTSHDCRPSVELAGMVAGCVR